MSRSWSQAMKQRLLTAVVIGCIAASVGVAVAIQQDQKSYMFGIAIISGLVGFFLGFVFKFRVV